MNLLRKITDPIRRMLGGYDSHGLKYSIRFLDSIKDDIAFYSLTKQAEFADATTVKNVKNDLFINYSAPELFDNVSIEKLIKEESFNATDVGNLAFLALNANKKEIRTRCMEILDNYKTLIKMKQLRTNKK